ncbi:hypothetical protein Gotri_024284 [Gossypium trilobum]|uniref:F-box/kelch-repeat protein n=1 Tax=Gossypium trilobum TaxID=34281 RepID=A0A7J9DLX9_9ROSI|nr:hypothetical protein [Gossypium trilobum]
MHASIVIDGKVYTVADRNGVCYEVKNYLGNIMGYDVKEGTWKELKGLEKGLSRFLCGATIANLGGKLMVTNEAEELWGNIKWSDVVLLVPKEASIVHCLAVAL